MPAFLAFNVITMIFAAFTIFCITRFRPPSSGGGRRFAIGLGVAVSALVAGGALVMFDPLNLVTEQKP